MSELLKETLTLKTLMESKLKQKERATGAIETLLKELKVLGASSLEEAELLQAKLTRKVEKEEVRLQEELAQLQEEWNESTKAERPTKSEPG